MTNTINLDSKNIESKILLEKFLETENNLPIN